MECSRVGGKQQACLWRIRPNRMSCEGGRPIHGGSDRMECGRREGMAMAEQTEWNVSGGRGPSMADQTEWSVAEGTAWPWRNRPNGMLTERDPSMADQTEWSAVRGGGERRKRRWLCI